MSNFITKPNLPENRVKTVVIDYRTGLEILSSLAGMEIDVIKTVCCNELYDAIKGHPDILIHHVIGENIVIAPNVFERLAPKFSKKGFALTKGATWLHRNYPYNIAYNVLRIGNLAFHNTKYTDPEILKLYEKYNIKLIHMNQGYAKCSVCVVDEHSAITHDKGAAKVLEDNGIEVLFIEPGNINIDQLDYGFIGGSSGMLSKDIIAFSGNIERMKDYVKIMEFIALKGISIKILSDKKIMDIGSIIPISY
ncbi:MAG: hypothetical protein GX201_04120 [Clostridiales bacterium]|nr:hypothetical protein [Clostridiales bacterium]